MPCQCVVYVKLFVHTTSPTLFAQIAKVCKVAADPALFMQYGDHGSIFLRDIYREVISIRQSVSNSVLCTHMCSVSCSTRIAYYKSHTFCRAVHTRGPAPAACQNAATRCA